MRIYGMLNRAAGWTDCRVTGTLPAAFLNRCTAAGIELLDLLPQGEYSLLVRLRTGDLKRASVLAIRAGCELTPLQSGGIPRLGQKLLRRWAAALGLALVLGVLAWSRLHIWEIHVTGNETVPTGVILDGLRECGVDVGAFWPGFTSDTLRNKLLSEVPGLSWATVNIHGCRAEVIVRERTGKPEIWRERDAADVVAVRPGFVRQVRALSGTALVHPGSAVEPGEVLISAQVDSAFAGPRLVGAAGSVTAETWYELTAVCPLSPAKKQYTGEGESRWAVILGKNRYNFYRSSSISPAGCDTITREWQLSLPGLFSIPVTLVRETDLAYGLSEGETDRQRAERFLKETLYSRLRRELGAGGTAEEAYYSTAVRNDALTVTLRARCTQEIGKVRPRQP